MNRRSLLQLAPGAAAALAAQQARSPSSGRKPNILFVMTDQQRFDTIAALGNSIIHTPNLDRLVQRGITFTNAYSPCPVCVPARYTIRTGCEPHTTRIFSNAPASLMDGQQPGPVSSRCGPYLAQTMQRLGYRTFGVGKFHTHPWNEEIGYEVHLRSEELYSSPAQRKGDAYAAWIASKHPAYDFLEGLMGERTEMYYMPQMSPMPAEVTVEGWAASQAVEQIANRDERPYFGFVSFIGPHPPVAPPIPFNRLYDPDRMPNRVRGDLATAHMDEQIPFMNYAIWSEDINDSHARVVKSRYYGEITYIDQCIGRILDAVEKRGDADNTVICFFSDHGDHLGDHHGWQKESFFDVSCHVPFLLSWPARFPAGVRRSELVSLTDLFGIATSVAGAPELRQGSDVVGLIEGKAQEREHLFGFYGTPGTPLFKIMVRQGSWKYIYLANGGREQLFDLQHDRDELKNVTSGHDDIRGKLREVAARACDRPELRASLDGNGLRAFPFAARPLQRIYQFDRSRGVTGFPKHPAEVLKNWRST